MNLRMPKLCNKPLEQHGCFLESGHVGECKCSPYCAVGHSRSNTTWVKERAGEPFKRVGVAL